MTPLRYQDIALILADRFMRVVERYALKVVGIVLAGCLLWSLWLWYDVWRMP